MRKWYVGDRYDNWSEHDTCEAAAKAAASLEKFENIDDFSDEDCTNFVYMLYLTPGQFDAMCKDGFKSLT